MGPTFLLRAFSKSPNSSSNFGPSGCANRMHKVHRLLRPSTFCRNVRAPVWSKLHTRMTVVSPVLVGKELLPNPHRAHGPDRDLKSGDAPANFAPPASTAAP